MRSTTVALLGAILFTVGCSEDQADPDSEEQSSPTKEMTESKEFESMDAFFDSEEAGFVILHQEKAQGNDFRDKEDTSAPRLAERFAHFLADFRSRIGEPDQEATGWDLGIPTFASGNGYALWNGDSSFMSLFVSFDNPEDPSFVILARAPLWTFDPTPGAADPWGGKWMEKGEW